MGAPTASSLTTHPPLAAGEPVIIILDHEGHIQRFNSACERYTGLREQDVIGKNAFRLFLHHRGGVRVSIRRFYTREDSLKTEIVLHAQGRQRRPGPGARLTRAVYRLCRTHRADHCHRALGDAQYPVSGGTLA